MRSNCPGHNFRTLYVSIYNIFPYFLYILNICLNVVHLLLYEQRIAVWAGEGGEGAGRAGRQGVWGGESDYLLERCLHISKSYVSCLGIKYDIVFYLFAKKKIIS